MVVVNVVVEIVVLVPDVVVVVAVVTVMLVLVTVVVGHSPNWSAISPAEVMPPLSHSTLALLQPHSSSHWIEHLIVLHGSGVVVVVLLVTVSVLVVTVLEVMVVMVVVTVVWVTVVRVVVGGGGVGGNVVKLIAQVSPVHPGLQ